jgi:hypothetical protein
MGPDPSSILYPRRPFKDSIQSSQHSWTPRWGSANNFSKELGVGPIHGHEVQKCRSLQFLILMPLAITNLDHLIDDRSAYSSAPCKIGEVHLLLNYVLGNKGRVELDDQPSAALYNVRVAPRARGGPASPIQIAPFLFFAPFHVMKSSDL